ncbi:MAG: hypothetical protein FWG77_06710 [Treponema sp.]|nr:hypothetical protein [Treponema sp.]
MPLNEDNIEKLIFSSPKKYKIIAIKNLLENNDIPISSIKIHIQVRWSLAGVKGSGRVTGGRERRDNLNVPIEEFNEKLNDAQTFELYTYEEYENMTLEIIEKNVDYNFFGDYIFRTDNYDQIYEIYLNLKRNNIPCDNIVTKYDDYDNEEYLLFTDPENREPALSMIDILQKK